jgi:hypothetical protein
LESNYRAEGPTTNFVFDRNARLILLFSCSIKTQFFAFAKNREKKQKKLRPFNKTTDNSNPGVLSLNPSFVDIFRDSKLNWIKRFAFLFTNIY